ncbi:hypothetical protein HPB48_014690 [Haemaphysalis longicornis]|uniref:Uncharacterized protein n=1 Tax=Haemaphysalis longicornis TaxID=44386 RepID=A0A9J6GDZ0_HAELO|nr:hypothetical protein HPB48_014690 [Haemaphysalis longicornis]
MPAHTGDFLVAGVLQGSEPSAESSGEASSEATMISRRKILSRSRDELNVDFTLEEEEDVWYQKEKLFKVQVAAHRSNERRCTTLARRFPNYEANVLARLAVDQPRRLCVTSQSNVGQHRADDPRPQQRPPTFDGKKMWLNVPKYPLRYLGTLSPSSPSRGAPK